MYITQNSGITTVGGLSSSTTTANTITKTPGFPYWTNADNITIYNSISKSGCKGVYEYIIYLLEEGEFELLDEGKIYANSEQNAKDKVLFEFAKSEEGEDYKLEDLNIQVRLF